MIASTNSKPSKEEFEKLLSLTLKRINTLAKSNSLNAAVLAGRDLEGFIEEEMNKAAQDTSFSGTIIRHGGQLFPDIVVNKYYGVEVKSTTQNHWKTTGNSVLESTRIKGVERIYLLFGKLAAPIEFRCRPYEECLSDVVVTHSPRYLIDMDLSKGKTIFDKMEKTYDQLRLHQPPLEPVVNYYRSRLKPGEQIWWLGKTSNLVMKFWTTLLPEEKEDIRIKGFSFFPEIFGSKPDKFNNMATWLVQDQNIVCPNMRDIYSAGGQVVVDLEENIKIPRIIFNTLIRLEKIFKVIKQTPLEFLENVWVEKNLSKGEVIDLWIKKVASEINGTNNEFNAHKLFEDYISYKGIKL